MTQTVSRSMVPIYIFHKRNQTFLLEMFV